MIWSLTRITNSGGYSKHKPLEPGLAGVLGDIQWSQHLVLTTPMWWGGLPAKLKGLIDRTFLPGETFDTRVGKGKMPRPMLVGRTARVILTGDTPGWLLRLMYGNAILRQLRGQILGFVGFKPSRFTYFSAASHPAPGILDKWQSKVQRIGAQAT